MSWRDNDTRKVKEEVKDWMGGIEENRELISTGKTNTRHKMGINKLCAVSERCI